jgi:murein DD-endopeptidase MepM/ murein hydrolase activator NlpD
MIPEITGAANLVAKPDPKEVASKVQSMFTEFMLKAMEESVDAEDGLFGNSASSDIYRGMLRENLAKAISEKMKSPFESILAEQALTRPSVTLSRKETAADAEGLPVDGVVSSPEGWRRDPIDGQTRYHTGMDIAAPAGTTIRAVEGGRVIESGVKGGYGNAVVIQTEDGRKMVYAHNRRNLVQVGDQVKAGELIGEVGATGRATGPHVHFEVKF